MRLWALALVVAAVIGAAIVGAVRTYSPVPYWDMWNGYLGFYDEIAHGRWSAFVAQHNEHRLILSRVLFWIDIAHFRGAGAFLIVVNYLLVGGSCAAFCAAISDSELPKPAQRVISLLTCAWLFSWMQEENFTWAFQSQMLLAQLLPFVSFYLLHRSVTSSQRGARMFVLACATGVAAAGTMANGVMTLPLLTTLAAVLRLRATRTAVLASLSIVVVTLYLWDYKSPAIHGTVSSALLESPGVVARYVVLYLGAPFYYLTGRGRHGELVAMAAGLTMIVVTLAITPRIVRAGPSRSHAAALLAFVVYVGATALGTSGGRVMFGAQQALTSRYTTSSLMAWVALAILVAPHALKRPRLNLALAAALLLGLVHGQREALASRADTLFERDAAALALELRARDPEQVRHVFPDLERALAAAEPASRMKLSVFGMRPFRDAYDSISKQSTPRATRSCAGSIDGTRPLPDDAKFVGVTGWVFDGVARATPRAVRLVTGDGVVVGVAVTGQSRDDVAAIHGDEALRSGYKGYVLASHRDERLFLEGVDHDCVVPPSR